LINKDFLTPKKKQQNFIADKDVEEHIDLIQFVKNRSSIKSGDHLINKDFLTPKKKQQNFIADKDVEEHIAHESYKSPDSIKEVIHHVAEAQNNRVKTIRLNPLTKYHASIPDWAMLSFSTMSLKKRMRHR